MQKQTALSKLTKILVSYILYASFVLSPTVTDIKIPNNQISKVLQTSAKDLEIGFIFFEIVTAIGTDIEIDTIKQRMNIQESIF